MDEKPKNNNGYIPDDIKETIEANGETEIHQNDDVNKNEESKKQKLYEKPNMVSMFNLYRFATKCDVLMMIVGTIGALANGASFPVMMILFTDIIDTFTDYSKICSLNITAIMMLNQTIPLPPDPGFSLIERLQKQAIYLTILGVATMVVSYFQVAFWLMPAERQVRVIRKSLFKSILKQEIGWFDVYKVGELTNRLSDDINKIKDGLGDKFGSAIQFLSTFVVGMIIGFIRGWKLTLVILSLSPILFFSAVLFTKLAGYLTSNELKSYAKAGAIAEEVLTAIRTVFAFNGVKKESARYEKNLEDAKKFGIKKSTINGFLLGFVWFIINGAYALGFWYGWTLTKNRDPITGDPEYTVGKILLVFFSIIMSVFSFGNAAPFAANLATARAAAYEVFQIIDRVPKINSESEEGIKPKNIMGNIEFKNVNFRYPARTDVQVLNNLDISIRAGTTVALVGSSGCGKSTCIQLLQRFYDPLEGNIFIDGQNIQDLNVRWLRDQIGVVNQEPILFQTSILENIRMGRENVTMDEIIQAAIDANAHDFIMKLPEKYDTLVGNRGSQLSGGQKQRVAIARAIVRNPTILLLDEATSALDNESESIVQAALDRASLGRTTIIVAHRLTTIRNADIIFAVDKGQVFEYGTHDELMDRKGLYYSLVVSQQSKPGAEEDDDEDINNEKNKYKRQFSRTLSVNEPDKYAEVNAKENVDNEQIVPESQMSFRRLFSYQRPEWFYIIVGCIAALVSGAVQPAFSVVFSKIINVFSTCDMEKQRKDIILYCILFIGFGVVTFISYFLQGAMFGVSGENLTRRLRALGFRKMLQQEVAWFDDPKNNVGTLCTRLAVDAAAVQGATGVRIGFVLMNIGNLGIGLIIAFVYSWAITLLILAFIPFMIISGVLQTKMLTGFSGKDKEILEEAGQISNQAISNIRTVAILNKEDYFFQKYSSKFEEPYKVAMRSANLYAFMFGFTNSVMFYATAAAYMLGAYLVEKNLFNTDFEKIMIVFSCVIFGAQSVGQASSFMPDYTKGKIAFVKMVELFDRKPIINNWESESKEIIDENNFDGVVKFERIDFRYPTRPDAQVLKNFTLSIQKGQRIALVGSSGCGKSTVLQLLERYYDPDFGEVKLSDKSTKDLDIFSLRSQIGIVSQEPILFDATIQENIAYGDNTRNVPMNEIIEAAKQANIHEFICSLPQGYDTNVGSKGTQLSGGQKQRVAIARALIRNPKILLLDEATSALDTESEKVVQEALDRAQEGRTCIIIAHRLSTIQNADVIYVMKGGKIIEYGTHEQLLRNNGFYKKLYTRSH